MTNEYKEKILSAYEHALWDYLNYSIARDADANMIEILSDLLVKAKDQAADPQQCGLSLIQIKDTKEELLKVFCETCVNNFFNVFDYRIMLCYCEYDLIYRVYKRHNNI